MSTGRFVTLGALCAVLGCHPVEETGGLFEPLEDGVIAQATLDGEVIASAEAAEPETPAPEPETAEPEPEPETSEPEPETSDLGEEPLWASVDPDLSEATEAPELTDVGEGATHGSDPDLVDAGELTDAVEPSTEAVVLELPTPQPLPVVEPEPITLEPMPDDVTPEPATPIELPEPPRSDADAIAALDSITRADAPPAPSLSPDEIAAAPLRCPSGDPLLVAPLGDLEMMRWWTEAGSHRAELRRTGTDEVHVVQIGDRVGPDGGKVVRIEPTQVVIGEIGFSLADEPQITVRQIKLGL